MAETTVIEREIARTYLNLKLSTHLFDRYPRIFNRARCTPRGIDSYPLVKAHRTSAQYAFSDLSEAINDGMIEIIGAELAYEILRDLTRARFAQSDYTPNPEQYTIFPAPDLVEADYAVSPNTFEPILGFRIFYGVMTLEEYNNGRERVKSRMVQGVQDGHGSYRSCQQSKG